MSGWRKCDTCRKVRPTDEFDGGATTCLNCLTAKAPKRRATAPVTRTAANREPQKAADGGQRPADQRQRLLGSIGSGDLEVRERRARRAAQEALAASHPEEFALLLRDAREKEGLRPLAGGGPASASSSGSAVEAGGAVEAGPET